MYGPPFVSLREVLVEWAEQTASSTEEMLRRLICTIEQLQDPDSPFRYWRGDRSSDAVTTAALRQLLAALMSEGLEKQTDGRAVLDHLQVAEGFLLDLCRAASVRLPSCLLSSRTLTEWLGAEHRGLPADGLDEAELERAQSTQRRRMHDYEHSLAGRMSAQVRNFYEEVQRINSDTMTFTKRAGQIPLPPPQPALVATTPVRRRGPRGFREADVPFVENALRFLEEDPCLRSWNAVKKLGDNLPGDGILISRRKRIYKQVRERLELKMTEKT
jgi:hypothetical protein